MGKSYTPKYRVEYRDNSQVLPGGVPTMYAKRMEWCVSRDGKANAANLEKWRKAYNESFAHGGVNWQCSILSGVVIHIYRAWIVEQKTGQWVAEVNAPMFEIV